MSEAIQKLEQPKASTPDANEFSVMKETSTMLVKTGFLPQAIKTPEQAIAIILTGRELGIGTMAALNTINVIQGKPAVSPQLMLALIERSGQLENIDIQAYGTDELLGVSCTMKRKNRSAHTERFGKAEAKAMNLADKDNYKKQPETMYRWRAVSACARVVFPDVILGLYTPDEMGAVVNEDGEAVDLPKANIHSLPTKTELVEATHREILITNIKTYCKELNILGDSIEWNAPMLVEYTQQLFDSDLIKSSDDLTDEQLKTLEEDLGVRLGELEAAKSA